jgi:hypothetical protein
MARGDWPLLRERWRDTSPSTAFSSSQTHQTRGLLGLSVSFWSTWASHLGKLWRSLRVLGAQTETATEVEIEMKMEEEQRQKETAIAAVGLKVERREKSEEAVVVSMSQPLCSTLVMLSPRL